MHNAKSSGNTLSEYVLLGGLITLACVGALQLLGGSMGDLFEENSRHIDEKTGNNPGKYAAQKTLASAKGEKQSGSFWGTPIGDLLSSPFQPHKTNQSLPAISGQQLSIKGIRGSSGSSDFSTIEGETLTVGGTINLHSSGGGGVNATSAEGSTKKVLDTPTQRIQAALNLVSDIEEHAATMPEGADKEWFLQAARIGYMLAGSQASSEVTLQGNQNKLLKDISDATLNAGDISYNIKTYYTQTQSKLTDMPPTMSASDKKLGAALVNSILKTMDTGNYDTTATAANPKTYSRNLEEVSNITAAAINAGGLSGTSVDATLINSATLNAAGQ